MGNLSEVYSKRIEESLDEGLERKKLEKKKLLDSLDFGIKLFKRNLEKGSADKSLREGLKYLYKQREGLDFCGTYGAMNVCIPCGAVDSKSVTFCHSCNCKLCPGCQKQRSNELYPKIEAAIGLMKSPKMLTFSVRHKIGESLDSVFNRLKNGDRKLRQRNLWKSNVRGWIRVLEFTYGEAGYHVHFHYIIDSPYIPQAVLSDTWFSITRDSMVVDIREVDRSDSGAIREMAKYAAKGSDFMNIKDEGKRSLVICEFLISTKGLRLFSKGGDLYGKNKKAQDLREIVEGRKEEAEIDKDIEISCKSCDFCGSIGQWERKFMPIDKLLERLNAQEKYGHVSREGELYHLPRIRSG